MPKAGVPSGRCTVCAHAERGRIDFLAASGSPLKPLAEQFGVSRDSLQRHFKAHVTETYKRQVKIGPLQSEDSLRKLAAEEGVSVFEHLQGLRALLPASSPPLNGLGNLTKAPSSPPTTARPMWCSTAARRAAERRTCC
jgi:hypothetical protein